MGKRCHCEKLFRRLEEDVRLRTLPMGAQMMWLRLVRLAASTPGFDGALHFGSEFGFLVAVSLAVSCAETEAETHLAALERRGLVLRGEDGASLVIPDVEPAAARSEAARINGLRGGRPRKGESREAYRERRQGNLLLAVAGGAEAHAETQAEPNDESSRAAAVASSSGKEAAAVREALEWVSLGQELVVIAGLDPARGGWNLMPVKGWMDAGVPADVIRETVRAVAARPRPKPIGSLQFFHRAVMEAHEAARAAEAPPVRHEPCGYEAALREWQRNGAQGVPPSLAEWRASQDVAA